MVLTVKSWKGIFKAWLSGGADVYTCTPDGKFDSSLDDFLRSLDGKKGKLYVSFVEG